MSDKAAERLKDRFGEEIFDDEQPRTVAGQALLAYDFGVDDEQHVPPEDIRAIEEEERKATVERIRAAYELEDPYAWEDQSPPNLLGGRVSEHKLLVILDAEAAREKGEGA